MTRPKLDEELVSEMVKMRNEGKTLKYIAEHFNCSNTNIHLVMKNHGYKKIVLYVKGD